MSNSAIPSSDIKSYCTFISMTIVLIMAPLTASSYEGHQPSHETQVSYANFDFLMFIQHWPLISCFTTKNSKNIMECNIVSTMEWKIRGIWPNKNYTKGPTYCNNKTYLYIPELDPIMDTLQTEWIDVFGKIELPYFWLIEWQKHGSCSLDLKSLDSELKYFSKGLELLEKYNMKEVLAKANIKPEEKLKVKDYLNGIRSVLGKSPMVTCRKDVGKKKTYLAEVRICFDPQFNLIDCTEAVGYPTNCDSKANVIYPSHWPI